jgi:hypothetical protein
MDYSTAIISAVLLADGWHEIAPGTFHIDLDPSFSDPLTGAQVVPVGGAWLRFNDPAGNTYAAPLDRIECVRHEVPPTGGTATLRASAGTATS